MRKGITGFSVSIGFRCGNIMNIFFKKCFGCLKDTEISCAWIKYFFGGGGERRGDEVYLTNIIYISLVQSCWFTLYFVSMKASCLPLDTWLNIYRTSDEDENHTRSCVVWSIHVKDCEVVGNRRRAAENITGLPNGKISQYNFPSLHHNR